MSAYTNYLAYRFFIAGHGVAIGIITLDAVFGPAPAAAAGNLLVVNANALAVGFTFAILENYVQFTFGRSDVAVARSTSKSHGYGAFFDVQMSKKCALTNHITS